MTATGFPRHRLWRREHAAHARARRARQDAALATKDYYAREAKAATQYLEEARRFLALATDRERMDRASEGASAEDLEREKKAQALLAEATKKHRAAESRYEAMTGKARESDAAAEAVSGPALDEALPWSPYELDPEHEMRVPVETPFRWHLDAKDKRLLDKRLLRVATTTAANTTYTSRPTTAPGAISGFDDATAVFWPRLLMFVEEMCQT